MNLLLAKIAPFGGIIGSGLFNFYILSQFLFLSEDDDLAGALSEPFEHRGSPLLLGSIRPRERVSRPGRRHYVGAQDIPRVRNGLGMAILSTSQGVVSDRTARAEGVGGEVMALVW